MRKDVKIGLAIGGLLLAVLVVYLMVPKEPGTANQIAQDVKSPDAGTGTPPVASGGTSGTSSQGTADGGGAAIHNEAAQPTEPTHNEAAAPAPAQEEPRPANTPENDERAKVWAKMLETGVMDAKISLAAVDKPADPFGDPKPTAPAGSNPEPKYDTGRHDLPAGQGGSNTGAGSGSGGGATAAPSSTGLKEHTVQPGETLSKISLSVYGDPRFHEEIKKANPNLDERRLRPGTVLKIPDASTFKTKSSPQAQQAAATINPSSEYRIEAGDNLHKVALKLYGKADKADAIYELNKDKIGPDPAKVKIGMVLKLPEAPHAATSH